MGNICTIVYLAEYREYKLTLQDERGTLLYFTPIMLNARNLAERMLSKPVTWEWVNDVWKGRVAA